MDCYGNSLMYAGEGQKTILSIFKKGIALDLFQDAKYLQWIPNWRSSIYIF